MNAWCRTALVALLLENRGRDAIGLAQAQHGCLLSVSTTPEFRHARAKAAANARHHPERSDGEQELLKAASRERKLREVFGPPPEGTTWLDHFRLIASQAPPLTDEQRNRLAVLLGSAGNPAGAVEAGR